MTDETAPRRGDAAFREQRDELAKRNAEAHRRGQEERKVRDRSINARARVHAAREAEELAALNAQIAERRTGGSP